MEALPFALSIHHFINSVGADAGFAAIIGLAILVLLFFAQARETASLRQRAAESDEHVRQLELRLSQISRDAAPATAAPTVAPAPPGVQRPGVAPAPPGVRAAPAPAPAFVVSRAAGKSPATSAFPGAPAGVGAPAMSSATRLIPSEQISIAATGGAAAVGGAAVAGAAEDGDRNDAGGAVLAPPQRIPGPPPATAAGGANGAPTTRVPPPAPVPDPGGAGRRPSSGSPLPPPPPADGHSGVVYSRSSRGRVVAVAVAAALLVAAAIVVVLILTSGSTGSNHPTTPAASARRSGRHHGVLLLKASEVSVTVLNGTTTPNLAHDITHLLDGMGYKTGTPATATDQNQTATVVGYLPGHHAAGLLVAKSLKLGRSSVQPVTAANERVACPQSSGCTAKVIVTVGTDLASAATTSTPATSTSAGST